MTFNKMAQEKKPFSSPVFHAISCGAIRFVVSVSYKNHLLTAWKYITANEKLPFDVFLKLTLATKRITPCERA